MKTLLLILLSGLVLLPLGGCGLAPVAKQQAPWTPPAAAEKSPDPTQRQLLFLQASQAALLNHKDYQVGPEDLLDIKVFGQDNLNREVRVNGQGEISLPLVGAIQVAGLSPQEIEQRLKAAYGSRFLRQPHLTVGVKEYRHQRVAVTGAVEKPGWYDLLGPRTLLEMLAAAGGLQERGASGRCGDVVHVIRHQSASDLLRTLKQAAATPEPARLPAETIVIDLRRLLRGEAPELNLPLRNGDVVYVPFAGQAYVFGGVRRPGAVAVKDRLTLTQALTQAGGVDPVLATSQVELLRFGEQGNAGKITVDLNRILAQEQPDIPLKDGDVVVVGQSRWRMALFTVKELLPGSISGAYRITP